MLLDCALASETVALARERLDKEAQGHREDMAKLSAKHLLLLWNVDEGLDELEYFYASWICDWCKTVNKPEAED